MSVTIGLVGLGHLGKIHLQCLSSIDNVQLVGIFDTDKALTYSLAEKYHCKAFESLEDLLAQVDAVDIVSPTTTHFEIAVSALRAGKHIFVEKPIVSTLSEAEKLTIEQKNSGKLVQVGHVERFNPAYLALKNVDLNPLFIEAHRLSEFNPRGTDVPVVLDLMIHDLDLVLQLVPAEITHISASGVCVVSDTPDIANVRLEFANGAVANITASRMALQKMRKMRLFQKDAYVSMDFLQKQAQIIRLETPAENMDCIGMEIQTKEGKRCILIDMPEVPVINAIQEELRSFVNSIASGIPVAVPLADGVKALELAEKIVAQIEQRTQKIQAHGGF
jgi:predicted dehydrogenase